MKKSSRSWTEEEDSILKKLMSQQQSKRTWDEIAQIIKQQSHSENCEKSGKQCRQRWHNQLDSTSKNNEQWTEEQNKKLFQLQQQIGNKWAQIAKNFDGRADNTVKNHFYSTMRRGLRRLNSYIYNIKRKISPVKQFKGEILNKILIVADGNQNDKLNAKDNTLSLSQEIKQGLVRISLDQNDNDSMNHPLKQNLFQQISLFAKNCKRRKGKKTWSNAEPDKSSKNSDKDEDQPEKNKQMVSKEELKNIMFTENDIKMKRPPENMESAFVVPCPLELPFFTDFTITQPCKGSFDMPSPSDTSRLPLFFSETPFPKQSLINLIGTPVTPTNNELKNAFRSFQQRQNQ